MDPKVSIIVPVYNVEQYLDRCVQSLLNQTLKDIEIILVDDGSPDNCPALCDEYARMHENIKVVHKENAGLGMACNSGIDVATGEYIAFVDSDDWVDSEMYAVMYSTAKQYDADMVFSGLWRVNERGEKSIMYEAKKIQVLSNKVDIEEFAFSMIANDSHERQERTIPMSAKVVLYRRQHLIDNIIRFESERVFLSEDLLFNLDCLNRSNTIVELPKVFYNYFTNQFSLSSTIRPDRFQTSVSLYNEIIKRYQFADQNKFMLRARRMFIGYVRMAVVNIFKSQLDNKIKLKYIQEIRRDSTFNQVSEDYLNVSMPFDHRIFLILIIYNLTIILMIMISFRNIIKG